MLTDKGVKRGRAVLVLFLCSLVVSLSGCELTVEEPQPAQSRAQHSALSMGVSALPDYDVAVCAIDFDPPLGRESLISSRKAVKLLAALENRGTMPLSGVVVEAQVTSQKGEFSAQDRLVVERLSPGETKLVEFEGVAPATTLPRSPSFRVQVSARARQFDANPANNSREVIVRISD